MYYVITRGDNSLVGVTPENAYAFNLPNVSIHEMDGGIPDLNEYEWNFVLNEFTPRTGIYTKKGFLAKFTLEERTVIRASTDPIVLDIMNMLNVSDYISTQDQQTIDSVYYLASVELITLARVAEILT